MSKLPESRKLQSKYREGGQALLVILLTMSVILTVVLSAVSRTVTEITITSYEESTLRAFSAAEAGVEEALLKGTTPGTYPPVTLDTGLTYQLSVSTPVPSNQQDFNYPADLVSGESATFWFVSHNASGQLSCVSPLPCFTGSQIRDICWGASATINNQTPAIEISLFYDPTIQAVSTGDFSGVRVVRFAYDPNSGRTSQNNFAQAATSCSILGTAYPFTTGNIVLPPILGLPCTNARGCILMAKVRMFYNPTPSPLGLSVTVSGGGSLPAQGIQVESVGVAAESTRRLNVFQAYPEPPNVLDAVLFSLKDIVK